MLKKLALAVAAAFIGLTSPALAQNPQTVKLCVPTSGTTCPVVTATAPLPVTGTFSATLAGFTPNGNYTTLTATAVSSASTALPAGTVVAFQNLSTIDVSCVLAAGAATATTNKLIVRGGATVYYTVGSNDHAACINQTGSASNVVGLAGGAGLGTAFGGGGGGGTVAQGNAGSNAQAWWTRIGDATSGPAKVQAGNAAATTDVALTVTDPNVLAAVNSPIPACSASPCTTVIGGVVLYQGTTALSTTNGIYSNLLQGNAVIASGNPLFAQMTAGSAYIGQSSPDPSKGGATPAFAFLALPATTTTEIIALSGSTKTYVTSMYGMAGGTVNVTFKYGTGTNCGTGTTTLSGPWPWTAQVGFTQGAGTGAVMIVPAGKALCITTDASVGGGVHLTYQQL